MGQPTGKIDTAQRHRDQLGPARFEGITHQLVGSEFPAAYQQAGSEFAIRDFELRWFVRHCLYPTTGAPPVIPGEVVTFGDPFSNLRYARLRFATGGLSRGHGRHESWVDRPRRHFAPYNLGVRYGKFDDRLPPRAYLDWCELWGAEIRRLLSPNGSFFLNLGAAPSNPMLPHELILRFRRLCASKHDPLDQVDHVA